MKTLIDIFLSMFEINGHELDLYFNRQSKIVNKDWSIFIDTATFKENKRMFWNPGNIDERHALFVLSMWQSMVYRRNHQAHIRQVIYKRYDTNGNLNSGVQSIVEIDSRFGN
jgi:predicted Abi (CAAX) family protease